MYRYYCPSCDEEFHTSSKFVLNPYCPKCSETVLIEYLGETTKLAEEKP